MDVVEETGFRALGRIGARATWAHGQGEVGADAADHGGSVVRVVVCGGAGGLAGGTCDGNAGWVGRVILHRRLDGHTTLGEGVAVDVGQIPEDALARWSKLELSDWAREVVGGRQLDGNAIIGAAVGLGVASLDFLHTSALTLADRRVVDGEATVVDDSGRACKG